MISLPQVQVACDAPGCAQRIEVELLMHGQSESGTHSHLKNELPNWHIGWPLNTASAFCDKHKRLAPPPEDDDE